MKKFAGDSFYAGLSDEEQKEWAETFYEEMIKQPDTYSDVHITTSTYAAFIKFKHNPSNLECDLSFRSGMSTTNSQLVKCVCLLTIFIW